MGYVTASVGGTRTGTEKSKRWRSLMNGTHLMVIGLTAAALLGLHGDVGSLFVLMHPRNRLLSRGSRSRKWVKSALSGR